MNIEDKQIAKILSYHWWVLLIRGIVTILLGALAWLQPGVSFSVLVLFFGTYCLFDGILGVWTALTGNKDQEQWWVLLLWGLIGIGVGVLTLQAPDVTTMALLFYIAIWAIGTGLLEIVAAIRLRKEIEGEWLLVLAGFASIVFGVFLMTHPVAGVLVLLKMTAIFAVVFGILFVILAFKARSFTAQLLPN